MDTNDLIATLRRDNYCLVTGDDGVDPQYDELGNLLVCKPESGELIPVPNVGPIRKLYDLPESSEETKLTNKTCNDTNQTPFDPNLCTRYDDDERSLIWVGQRSVKCGEAAKLLIKLVDNEKYRNLMSDRGVIKLKVWELIGEEIERSGYKIANTPKELALRTFQKWRNLERSYWKYKRMPQEDVLSEYPRKKKPFFFDDMHDVLSKREDYEKKCELFCSKGKSGNLTSSNDCFEDLLIDESSRDNIDLISTDVIEKKEERPPKEAVRLLVSLASQKYRHLVKNTNLKGIKFWERIYDEILTRGYGFATSRRDGALKLRNHWNKNKRLLKRRCKPKVTHTYPSSLRKQILHEYKDAGSSNLGETSSFQTNNQMEGDAVRALLTLLNTEEYYKLLNTNERHTWTWERIYFELEAMGYYISGPTVKAKSNKLYQKWKSLKRSFIKYEIAKSKGANAEKPAHSDLLLNIVYREVISKPAADNLMEINSPEFVNPTLDHDYGGFVHPPLDVATLDVISTERTTSVPVDPLSDTGIKGEFSGSQTTFTSLQHKSEQSEICNILLQIKSLHEANLNVQQQNYEKVHSLLKEQVNQQKTLNSLFTQFVVNQAKIRSERKRRKLELENSKHSDTNLSEFIDVE